MVGNSTGVAWLCAKGQYKGQKAAGGRSIPALNFDTEQIAGPLRLHRDPRWRRHHDARCGGEAGLIGLTVDGSRLQVLSHDGITVAHVSGLSEPVS